MAVLDVNGRTQTAHVFGDVVAENYGAHGGFARAALAHEEHLFLFLTAVHIDICDDSSPVGLCCDVNHRSLCQSTCRCF